MQRSTFIGNYLDFIDDDTACYSTSGSSELLSIGSAVGSKLGLKAIGIHIETLPPGRRTSWPHAESEEEEFGFVIEGTPDVWIDGYLHALKPGDFVAFPAGTGISHTFLNNSMDPVKLLVGGEKSKSTNKIIYPLHPERNELMKTQGRFWGEKSSTVIGPHNGLPTHALNQKWNIPHIETDRLIIRPLEMSDAAHVFAYASSPSVVEYVSFAPHQSLADSEAFIKTAHTSYLNGVMQPMAIVLKNRPDTVVGCVGAFWSSRPHKIIELGAAIHEDYWGQGIVPEALLKLIEVSWTFYDVQRIQCRCVTENIKSLKMLDKLGMTYEGTMYSCLFAKGRAWDMKIFSLTRPELK